MTLDQILNFIGLAMRARKVKSGESVILTEIKKRNLKLVIIASNASESTARNIKNKCDYYHVPLRVVGTKEQLGHALGKNERVNIGIIDTGFANKLVSMIDEYRKE